MKYLVKVGKVTIEVDSELDDPIIRKVLQMLCYVVQGVNLANQWPLFANLIHANASVLKHELKKKMI